MAAAKLSHLKLAPSEELLVRAAVTEGQTAQGLLTEWKLSRGFERYDEIDYGSMLLLPWVYRNLVRANINDPWLPQLAALSRYHWLKNTTRLGGLSPVLGRIQQSGARPLVGGSLALIASGYLNAAECPDFDPQIMLSPVDGGRAREVLHASGWRCKSLPPVPGWRSELWRGLDEVSLRVEYQWLPRRLPVVRFADLAPFAQSAELSGLAVLIPSATDLVELLCVQACQPRPAAGYRVVYYLVDVLNILQRAAARIDWERLLHQSQGRASLALVRQSLTYLQEQFAAPVPAEWLERAWQMEASANSWLTRHSPWRRYLRAEQAAGRNPSSLGAASYAWWQIASRVRLAKAS